MVVGGDGWRIGNARGGRLEAGSGRSPSLAPRSALPSAVPSAVPSALPNALLSTFYFNLIRFERKRSVNKTKEGSLE